MELKKIEPKPFSEFLRQNWMLLVAILYVLSPVDILPDLLPVLGLSDDLLVLLGSLLIRYAQWRKNKK